MFSENPCKNLQLQYVIVGERDEWVDQAGRLETTLATTAMACATTDTQAAHGK